MTNLHPVHASLRRLQGGRSMQVKDMEKINLPTELRDGLNEIALSIFTDMSNAGHGFADALLAVYLSGLDHGRAQ